MKKLNVHLYMRAERIISSAASRELCKFQEMLDAPVTLSLMGLGAFPASNEAFTGMIWIRTVQKPRRWQLKIVIY